LFNEAIKVASKDEDYWGQADALIKLAINLARSGSNDTNLVFKKVELVADEILTPRIQVDTLIKLAIALAQTQRKNEAKSVLDKVVRVITKIDEDDAYAVHAQSQFAVALAHIEYFSLAEKVIDIIQDKGTQVEVLSKLAVLTYAKDDNKAGNIFTKAEEIADQIEDGLDKVSALGKITDALEEVKNFSEAERIVIEAAKVARATKEGWRKPEILIKLATVLAKARCEENKVSAIFKEAEKVACSQKENLDRAKALSKLAVALVQSGRGAKPILMDLDEVIHEILDPEEKASEIMNGREKLVARLQEEQKVKLLVQLTQDLAQAQNFSKAEKIATSIQDDMYRAEALSKLAVALAHQDFSKAEKAVQAIEYKPAKVWALSKLAVVLADAGDKEADAVFNEAKKTAFSIEGNISKQRILIELAADQAQSGELSKAREIADSIEDDWAKAIALSKLAKAYALTKNFTEARKIAHEEVENIANTVEGGLYRLWVMSELTITLAHVLFFNRALSILGLKETPSEFLNALMEWQPAFEHIKPGIFVDILHESIHIFAWERPDWYEIDTILLAKT
jgi:tetratricopeptide (TPR) repeat protein